MVHKKYIKRGNKTFGPYLYENYRVGNLTKTRYLGKPAENKKILRINKNLFFFLGIIFLILTASYFFLYRGLTGRATFEVASSFSLGSRIEGNLNLALKEGELIPSDSLVKIKLGNQEHEISLSSLLAIDRNSGDYYAEGVWLNGSGSGYGFLGRRKNYPAINFDFLIQKETGEGTAQPEETKQEENITIEQPTQPEQQIQTPEEQTQPAETQIPTQPAQPEETKQEEKSQQVAQETEQQTQESAPLTGAVINEEKKIEGIVSKDKPFSYTLEENEEAMIIPGSVKINGKKIDDDLISLVQENNKVEITTEYEEYEEGFGAEFLQDNIHKLEISLAEFNITAEAGTLEAVLVYNSIEIVRTSKKISVEQPIPPEINETIPEENLTPEENITELTLTKQIPDLTIEKNNFASLDLDEYFLNAENYFASKIENITLKLEGSILAIIPETDYKGKREVTIEAYKENSSISDSFEINVIETSLANITNVSIQTLQYKARIRQPVRWLKIINKPVEENVTIELPKQAFNVSVKKISEKEEKEEITGRVQISGLTGQAVAEYEGSNWLSNLFKKIFSFLRLTGRVVEENISETAGEAIILSITEKASDIEVEYYTPEPEAFEFNILRGKRVVVSGPELGYKDILTFTEVDEKVKLEDMDKIKVYWLENNSYVPFNALDNDNNSLIDYVEWITPHLSNQTFDIILISKAEHLDEDRIFVEDVYEQVKAKDDVWQEIPSEHYLRVTFEQNLTNKNDITIYARMENNSIIVNGTEVPYDILQKKKRIDEIRGELR